MYDANHVSAFAVYDANPHGVPDSHTWEHHDIGESACHSHKNYLHAVTSDLYFPIGDAKYEAQGIPHVTLAPIRSLWRHHAGAELEPELERVRRISGC